jgi:signal transduction histidine kinase
MRQPLFGRLSLRKRIIFLALAGILIVLGLVGVSGMLSVRESSNRALNERLTLAQAIGNYLEYHLLRENALLFQNFSSSRDVDLLDTDLRPEREALRNIYVYSIFTDGVFVANREGEIILTQPPSLALEGLRLPESYWFQDVVHKGQVIVTPVFTLEPGGKRVFLVVAPVHGRAGQTTGLIGGAIDPTSRRFLEMIFSVSVGLSGYVDVINDRGMILASSQADRIFEQSDHSDFLASLIKTRSARVSTCHYCHERGGGEKKEREIIAFAPLKTIPWGVSIRQPEAEALGPAEVMRKRFWALSALIVLGGFLFAWGMAQSVVVPINKLIASVQRIAQGDLSGTVPFLGRDEIGRLGQNFEIMRVRLEESLAEITRWNRVLEERVRERTRELEASREELRKKDELRAELLKKTISAQEDERKRIARELHDETSQALVALTVAVDTAMASTQGNPAEIGPLMEGVKTMARRILEDVHRLIFDLRPNILDDLGLRAAVEVLAERYLDPLGIRVDIDIGGGERRLPPEVETVLFRIIQEGITNISRHSRAQEVGIEIEFRENAAAVEVTDDGVGFDPESIRPGEQEQGGWGLLGMRERVELLGGALQVISAPGKGTTIQAEVPLHP